MALTIEREIWRHRALLRSLVTRELRGRYVGSVMGMVWSILHPLTMLVIYTVVFSVIMQARPIRVYEGSATVSYAIFLCSGLIPWIFAQDVLTASCQSIVANGALIKRVRFPVAILPTQTVMAAATTFVISIALFLVFLGVLPSSRVETPETTAFALRIESDAPVTRQTPTIGLNPSGEGATTLLEGELRVNGAATGGSIRVLNHYPAETTTQPRPFPGWQLLALPLIMAFQVALLIGPAYLLATLNVFFRDTAQIIQVVTQLMFWATPLVYPKEALIGKFAVLKYWFMVNPMTHVVDLYRYTLIRHLGEPPAFPWAGLIYLCALTVLFYVAGRTLFRRSRSQFADEI